MKSYNTPGGTMMRLFQMTLGEFKVNLEWNKLHFTKWINLLSVINRLLKQLSTIPHNNADTILSQISLLTHIAHFIATFNNTYTY